MPKAMIKNLNIGWTKVRIEANDGTGKIKWFEGLSTNSAEKMEKIKPELIRTSINSEENIM